MSEQKEIWLPETGILDLPEDWHHLAVTELVSVRDAWQIERERLRAAHRLTLFTEQMSREWAIETGIIENLYDIERGVTQTLIEQGFQAAFLETGTTNKPRDWVIQMLKFRECTGRSFRLCQRRSSAFYLLHQGNARGFASPSKFHRGNRCSGQSCTHFLAQRRMENNNELPDKGRGYLSLLSAGAGRLGNGQTDSHAPYTSRSRCTCRDSSGMAASPFLANSSVSRWKRTGCPHLSLTGFYSAESFSIGCHP